MTAQDFLILVNEWRQEQKSFREVLENGLVALGIFPADLAREHRLSDAAISRWRSGKNDPHPLTKEIIVTYLEKRARRMVRR